MHVLLCGDELGEVLSVSAEDRVFERCAGTADAVDGPLGLVPTEGAIDTIREASAEHRSIAGYEADQAARAVVSAAGYGDAFVHRTGHSIDRDLHGSGPHLDDYETHDDRVLLPGVGFSVEPGIYLPGSFGIRSEVNVFMDRSGPVVTPREPQQEVIVRSDS